jgi:hypothetical protein
MAPTTHSYCPKLSESASVTPADAPTPSLDLDHGSGGADDYLDALYEPRA